VDEAVDAVIDFLEFPAGGNEGGPDCVVGWEVLERVQQAAAQRALSAHGSNAPRLPDGQFVQRHIRFPHCSKCKMLA